MDFACRELCKSLNFAIEMFQDDAVAAFNFKTLFLQRKNKPGVVFTPPKTNMEPENETLEEEIPIKNHQF